MIVTNQQNMNSTVVYADLSDLSENPAENERYGPYGTIGLHSSAIKDGSLFESTSNEEISSSRHPASRLLWFGECAKGKKFRVRLAHSGKAWWSTARHFT